MHVSTEISIPVVPIVAPKAGKKRTNHHVYKEEGASCPMDQLYLVVEIGAGTDQGGVKR